MDFGGTALERGAGEIFHDAERNTDRLIFRGELFDGEIDIWGEEMDAEASGFESVGESGVEAFSGGEYGSEKFDGVRMFEGGALIGFEGVGGAMGAAECVSLEGFDEGPDAFDFEWGAVEGLSGEDEFFFDFGDSEEIFFAESAAEEVGSASGKSSERLADLEDMFFVGDDPEGGAEDGFEGRVRIFDGIQSLGASGKLFFLGTIGGAWANDGDDGDEAIDILDRADLGEGDHGGAFDVVNAASISGGEHRPDVGIVPRGEVFELGMDALLGEELQAIADDGQAALGENIHFDQADFFGGIHFEVGGWVALGAGESGGEGGDWIPREDNSAGVHFGMAREAIEEGSHLESCLVRFFFPEGFG